MDGLENNKELEEERELEEEKDQGVQEEAGPEASQSGSEPPDTGETESGEGVAEGQSEFQESESQESGPAESRPSPRKPGWPNRVRKFEARTPTGKTRKTSKTSKKP